MSRPKRQAASDRSFELSKDGATLTVRIPMTLNNRARKLVVAPDGATAWSPPQPVRTTNALSTALARAYRWKEMIESGDYASTADLAKAEGINFSYLCRVLRLTLLSPNIVEAILNGSRTDFELKQFMRPFPIEWEGQDAVLTASRR